MKGFAGSQKFYSPSSVWGNHTDRRRQVVCGHPREWMHSDLPPSARHVPSSLRRLHPRAWRLRSSAPSSGQNAGVSTAPPHFPSPPSSTFAFICRFFLRCSLHLRYPRGQLGGRTRGEGMEGRGGSKKGGRERRERKEGEHLT